MDSSLDEVLRIESVFDWLADRGGNSAVLEAYRRIRLQLRPIRRIEVLLQDTGLDSVLRIESLRRDGQWEAVAQNLDEYHEQRIALSASLEKVMRQSA